MKKIIPRLCIILLIASAYTIQALDIVVTSNQDPTEAGKITLRNAINQVNSSADATNSISFNLGGADTIIFLNTNEGQLPTIVNQVNLNGIDQSSQKIIFIDGTFIPAEGSEEIVLNGLHFSGNGSGTSAANSVIQNIGIQNFSINSPAFSSSLNGIFIDSAATNCAISDCTIKNFFGESSADINGIHAVVDTGSITNNSIENLKGSFIATIAIKIEDATVNGNCSGNLINNIQGEACFGINLSFEGILTGNCTRNTITNLTSVIETTGINLDTLEGNCSHNKIDHLFSQQRTSGISILTLNGNCNNNILTDLSSITSNCISIFIITVAKNKHITCNTIKNLSGQGGGNTSTSLSGIDIVLGEEITIAHNIIENIVASTDFAQGIFCAVALTNSLITNNSISSITTPNNTGYGINLKTQSTGNDILSNSIFDINGAAINIIDNGLPTDAFVLLSSVFCRKNCNLTIRGQLLPSSQLTNTDQFLIQFFASPDNNPSEIKTLIGEYTHDSSQGNSFEVDLVPFVPTEFGQYLTATATALVEEPNHNLNTSEVSNALRLCAVQNNPLCPGCPEPGKPPVVCPVDCGNSIL